MDNLHLSELYGRVIKVIKTGLNIFFHLNGNYGQISFKKNTATDKAIWNDQDWLKKNTLNINEDETIEEDLKELGNKNPNAFLDIAIGDASAGRLQYIFNT